MKTAFASFGSRAEPRASTHDRRRKHADWLADGLEAYMELLAAPALEPEREPAPKPAGLYYRPFEHLASRLLH